jgi:SsrA-binding protein
MGKKKRRKGADANTIAQNKKARHDYFIEDTFEAGLVLQGWEVKSVREGRAQLREAYVVLKDNEAWLIGAHITPLLSASTHITAEPTRSRKLLLHREQIDRLIGAVERRGFTVVPTRMYWRRGRAKLEIGLAKGKRQQDKRATEKDRDWQRQKQRILKQHNPLLSEIDAGVDRIPPFGQFGQLRHRFFRFLTKGPPIPRWEGGQGGG